MVKKFLAVLGLVIVPAALPAPALAQDAKTFLATVAKAMGAENLKTIEYSGAGSMGVVEENGNPSAPRPLVRMKSYKRQMDLNLGLSRVDLVAVQNGADRSQTQTITSDSSWNPQYDFWINPYGFLKGAMTHAATVKPETLQGEKYNVVSYTVNDKYELDGYVNTKNLVERIQTRIDNEVPVEGVYLQYEDFGGLKFPTTIIEKQRGFNTLILIAGNVKANGPVNIQPHKD